MRVCRKQALSRVKYYYHTTAKYSSTNNDCIKQIAILAGLSLIHISEPTRPY